MSRLMSLVGVLFALGIIGISAVVNARYGMSLAREGFDQWVMVAVALFVDGGKALSWIFFAGAVGRREWLAALAAGLIFIGCLAYAVSGSLGYVAMNRAQSTATVASGADSARVMDEELQRKREELKAFGVLQPAAVIAKEIKAKRVDRTYTVTVQCTNATASASREFCAALARLEGEQSRAEAKESLEKEVAGLQAKRDALGGVAAVEKGDFQGALLAQLTSLNLSSIQLSLALLFVIVVESGACFFLWLALNHGERARAPAKPVAVVAPKVEAPVSSAPATVTVAPAPRPVVVASRSAPKALEDRREKKPGDLVAFVERCLDFMPGGSAALDEIVTRYKGWCHEEGFEALSDEKVGAEFGDFCVIAKIATFEVEGRIFLDGVVLVGERRKRVRRAR